MRRRALARHVVPLIAVAVFALPLLLLLGGSLRPVGLPPPTGLDLLPQDPTLDAYRRLPEVLPVYQHLQNSTAVVLIAVPATVAVAALAGFGIRLLPPRRRRWAVVAVLLVMTVPVTAVWATRFEVFRLVGATDSLVPLVSTALLATNPFYALVYAWAFSAVPDSQLAAARLEGASLWRTFTGVALPQARAATLAVAVLAFAFHWGNFLDGLLYLVSETTYTLPVGLRLLQLLNPTEFPLLLAGAAVLTAPPVVVLLLSQRVLLDDPLRIGGRGRRASRPTATPPADSRPAATRAGAT